MKTFYLFALFFVVISAMPQRSPDNNSDNSDFNGGNSVSTTAAPARTVTTASPEFLACLQACPSTMEYNPVCGSDNINYHNNGRLSCAQRCGKNVSSLRSGICTS